MGGRNSLGCILKKSMGESDDIHTNNLIIFINQANDRNKVY
jgi:hypothetical protein